MLSHFCIPSQPDPCYLIPMSPSPGSYGCTRRNTTDIGDFLDIKYNVTPLPLPSHSACTMYTHTHTHTHILLLLQPPLISPLFLPSPISFYLFLSFSIILPSSSPGVGIWVGPHLHTGVFSLDSRKWMG